MKDRTMANVHNCDTYVNLPPSLEYSTESAREGWMRHFAETYSNSCLVAPKISHLPDKTTCNYAFISREWS
jgi:hypothetical protein